jgi:tetratricopeptide (TPR) repeat protein
VTKFRFHWILSWAVVFFGLCRPECFGQGPEKTASGEKRRSADFYFQVGEVQMEKGNWVEARKSFDACLQVNHLFYDAYFSRAVVHEHLDSLNKALTDYNIYLEFRPVHSEALFGRAHVRMRLNQYDLAKQDLMKVLRVPAGATTSIFFRQDVNSGTADKMFTAHGAHAFTYNALGLVDMKLENYNEAISYFDSALYALPNDPEILLNRGLANEKKQDTASAIADYQKALRSNPHDVAAKERLDMITHGNKIVVDDSKMYDDIIAEWPFLSSGYAERAFMNFEKGNYSKALSDYNKAIELESTEPAYFINRGLIKEMLNDNTGAYNDYTAAIKLKKGSEKALLNRGNLLTKQGKLNEAVDDFSAAINHYPGYASAYFNRAVARKRLQQKDLACEDLQAAQRLGLPIDPKVWKSICGN